jgi:hypothetical protein
VNIKRIIAATAVAGVASLGFAATAFAEEQYHSTKEVPGHINQQKDGKVVTHYTQELLWEGVNYDYVVNTLGEFGPDAYLDNGMVMNRIKGDDGSVTIVVIVHKSHPAYTGTGTPEWGGDWEYKILNEGGSLR